MSRQKIIAGNWKMNLTLEEAKHIASSVTLKISEFDDTKVVFFSPFPYLSEVKAICNIQKNAFIGAQNCYTQASGAYTGEVSAKMLASVGCNYVLVGHSERRLYFKETDAELVLKIKEALQSDITPVFCIGETLVDRKSGNQFNIVALQLKNVLTHFTIEEFSKMVLAYEPVWAIGTGETATPIQAQEMHAYIRATIADIYDSGIANQVSILYGGSCNSQNAQELFRCPDVDGGLIGGASLNADDFMKIIYSF